jgi:hypothetical protein
MSMAMEFRIVQLFRKIRSGDVFRFVPTAIQRNETHTENND